MIPLQANIIINNPHLIGMDVTELMSKDWSLMSVKKPRDFITGRYSGTKFYTHMESDGQFLDENLVFTIEETDITNNDGSEKVLIINNTAFIEIERKRKVILYNPNNENLDDICEILTETHRYRTERSKLYRLRRGTIIYNMKANNVNTSVEDNVEFLAQHYKQEVDDFINDGVDDFKNAIISDYNYGVDNGTNTEVLGHLSSKLLIGYDGIIGSVTGTEPLYYQDGQGNELLLKDIMLQTIGYWK